jgi:hypothetical protein
MASCAALLESLATACQCPRPFVGMVLTFGARKCPVLFLSFGFALRLSESTS